MLMNHSTKSGKGNSALENLANHLKMNLLANNGTFTVTLINMYCPCKK